MMKRNLIIAGSIMVIASLVQAAPTQNNDNTPALQTEQQKLSYTIGVDLGRNFKQQGITIDAKQLARGIRDASEGKKLWLTQEQMDKTLRDFQKKLLAKKRAQFEENAVKNLKTGKAFLAKNKKAKGVVTTETGLQYKIVKQGTGESPSLNDTVTVEYTGKLIDGTVFDSTKISGKPADIRVRDTIKGWTEALPKMKAGGVWELYVPSELAYGKHYRGPIGPNETLIFKIELLGVKKAQTTNNKKKS